MKHLRQIHPNLKNPEKQLARLRRLITKAQGFRHLDEIESGLVQVAISVADRAGWQTDVETNRAVWTLGERLEALLRSRGQSAEVLDFPKEFANKIWSIENEPRMAVFRSQYRSESYEMELAS